jgi:TolB-like protein/tetratricopeptide (TPR) repeat protein
MKKLKIALHFIKIKLHNIGTLLIKTATGYVVGSFALIQVTSIVTDNISTVNIMGLAKESFMQYLFIGLLAIFPILMVVTYFIKRQSIDEKGLANINKTFEKYEDYKPKIGLIPFENLNDDTDSEFLVDGIVEDLITELSMVKEISVATRKTCFAFKGKDYTTESFKDEWGFDFIVSGSIRTSHDRLRISVELSDMTDDKVIWSNKFDKTKTDIFDIQDEIVTKIINCIVGEIEISSLKRAHRKPTDNMTSYEYTLKGRALNQKFDKDANAEAIKMLDAAIEADETNPLPYSWKACTIGQAMTLGFRDDDPKNMEEFLGALSKANELNDNDWNTNRILAEANITLHNFKQAKVYANKAYNANPNHTFVLSAYGDSLIRNGEIDNGIKIFETMYEKEPIPAMDSNSDRPLKKLFFAYYLNKNFDKCSEIFNRIEEHDFREWLVYVDIKVKQNIDYLKENWFESGMEKFKDRDWKKEVSLFHLDNKEVKSNLEKLAQNLY